MSQKLTPENLSEHQYFVHQQFSHQEIMPFVKSNLKFTEGVSFVYWLFNIAILAGAIIRLTHERLPLDRIIGDFCLCIVGMLLLIPIHELIHGLFYKLVGAKKVSYSADWKKLIFYAAADKFVARKYSFVVLAFAPFVLINIVLLYIISIANGQWAWFFIGTLLIHTGGCAGDFALVNYFNKHWDKDPITYDDLTKGETYFLLK
jgi:hypothetical protein